MVATKFDRAIHSKAHLAKSLLGTLERRLPGESVRALLVVNYHGTPREHLSGLRRQLELFTERFELIRPAELAGFFAGSLPLSERPRLLLTFDDGIRNNLYAAEILEKLSVCAWFFVIPDFVDAPPEAQETYFRRFVRPVPNAALESTPEDVSAMSWKELRALVEAGHAVGSHSASHTLRADDPEGKRHEEIAASRDRIAQALGLEPSRIDGFCTPNDTLNSTGAGELQLIRSHYRFLFTTYPGINFPGTSPLFIRRSNVESYWLEGAVTYSLGRLDRWRWRSERQRFSTLLEGPSSGA